MSIVLHKHDSAKLFAGHDKEIVVQSSGRDRAAVFDADLRIGLFDQAMNRLRNFIGHPSACKTAKPRMRKAQLYITLYIHVVYNYDNIKVTCILSYPVQAVFAPKKDAGIRPSLP
jgi:hypothetical protein